jgi:xylono-1,5-lactonase
MEMNLPVTAALAADALLGEGVLWDASRQTVWFVDIKRHRLWHFDPATGASGFAQAPDQIGWAIPTEEGPILCGIKDGLYTFAPETGSFDRLCAIPGEPAANRVNDACTDPWGRVWFGTMDDGERAPTGRFYVFDRGDIRAAGPDGIAITNGPAVNAAGDRIYFTDTARQKMYVAGLCAEGPREARLFADTASIFPGAYPDGPIVDEEDHVWVGFYVGGCVARFSPDGKLVATVAIPARDITKLAFGGADLRTAYVTSATKNMTAADMAQYPEAGSLFSFPSPVAGFAQTRAKLG